MVHGRRSSAAIPALLFAMLLATLLMAVGYPARLMTVAAAGQGDEFSHVYVEAQLNGQWVPLDPARYDSQFGVAPPMFTRGRWWSLTDRSYGEVGGNAGSGFAGLFGTSKPSLGGMRGFFTTPSAPGGLGFVGAPTFAPTLGDYPRF